MDDEVLDELFWGRRLPAAAWTHAAHLRVAWRLLGVVALEEAHLRLRVGIILLNASHGLVETPARGYHDTLTRAWLVLVGAARRESFDADSRLFLARTADRLTADAPLRHYSPGLLASVAARARFVEPDRAPLP